MSKIIILSRVSTDQQTLEQQTNVLLKESRNLGYSESDTIIIEDHESAISLDEQERHGLNKMKEYIENNNVDCVICYEVSRLSRRPKVLYSIRDYLIERQIQLVIVTPYMRLLDENGKMSQSANLLFSLFSSLSESEMIIKKERMSRGKRQKMSENIFCGADCCFGYKFDENKKLVVDEKNKNTVKKMFKLYLDGWSMQKIAIELMATGEFPQTTIESARITINRIFKNKIYYGDSSNTYYNYPPIISKEIFDKCREIAVLNRRRPKTSISTIYYCKGLLFSGYNNRMLTPSKASCVYKMYDGTRRLNISFSINCIDALVWHVVSEWVTWNAPSDNEKYKKELAAAIKTLNNKISVGLENKGDMLKQIDRIEKRIISGKLDELRGDRMQEEVNKQILELNNNIDSWINDLNNKENELENLKNDFVYSKNLNVLTDEEKSLLIRKTIDKIIVWKSSVRGTYDCDMQFKNGIIKSFTFKTQSKYPKFYDEYGEELNIDVVERIPKRTK